MGAKGTQTWKAGYAITHPCRIFLGTPLDQTNISMGYSTHADKSTYTLYFKGLGKYIGLAIQNVVLRLPQP